MGEIFLRFPNGKDKAITLSYDDGTVYDIRLINIMKQYGLKGTFNISSGLYKSEDNNAKTTGRRLTKSEAVALYKDSGMEIAVHGLTHVSLTEVSQSVCTYEVLQDRINLEKEYGCIVRGMAYPYSSFNDSVVEIVKNCGIVYSRIVNDTENFRLPTDWLRFAATCHHSNSKLMKLAEHFIYGSDYYERPKLFTLWGHSYEFEDDDNWSVIEEFAKYVGNREDIWYATNIEIYEYVTAFNQLVFNIENNMVYNPSGMDVFFQASKENVCVRAGQTIQFGGILQI